MNAFADARNTLGRLLERLIEAAPVAWRHDPLFRGASIGIGVALAVILLRLVGPHDPALERRRTATLDYVPGLGLKFFSRPGLSDAQQSSGDILRIAPGSPLRNIKIVPTPNTDRFGTLTPEKHP